MKILILSSNPRNDLDLDEEIRDLKDVIDDSRNRQNFEVEDALAVRAGDLHELFFRHEPQIVHFCGHGGGQPGLAFEGRDGGEQWVGTEALRDLFRLFSNRVTCVLLNACYSEQQANEIVHHIDYVIGMNQAIRDDAAIAFSKGFYRALGYNCSIEEAYEFGCNAIQLELSGGSINRDGTPVERKLQGVAEPNTIPPLPEHLKPILKKRIKTQPQPLPIPAAERQQLQKEVVQAVTGFGPRPIAPTQPAAIPSPSPRTLLQHRAAPYVIGGLVAFLIPAIGLYRYNQPPKKTVEEATLIPAAPMPLQKVNPEASNTASTTDSINEGRLQKIAELVKQKKCESAIKLLQDIPPDSPAANQPQFQASFKKCSESLFSTAQDSYNNGNIDKAISGAQLVPQNASNYPEVEAAIAVWTQEKQTFKTLKTLAEKGDLAGANNLLKSIKSPGLRSEAEALIGKVDQANQQAIFDKLIKALNDTKDIPAAQKALEAITDADLRSQAEARIKQIEATIIKPPITPTPIQPKQPPEDPKQTSPEPKATF
jgi:hypothetical protein